MKLFFCSTKKVLKNRSWEGIKGEYDVKLLMIIHAKQNQDVVTPTG